MEPQESVPLEGRPGRPYIESGARSHTYREIGSPDRVIVSLREGKLVNLACKEGCLVLASAYVRAWLSSWSCAHVVSWCGMML